MELNNFEINHDKDNQYYVIDTDTGNSFNIDVDLRILKESVPATHEEPGDAAEYSTEISNVDWFDAEGMSVGEIKPNTKIFKQLKTIMHNYLKEEADEYHEEAGDINFE